MSSMECEKTLIFVNDYSCNVVSEMLYRVNKFATPTFSGNLWYLCELWSYCESL